MAKLLWLLVLAFKSSLRSNWIFQFFGIIYVSTLFLLSPAICMSGNWKELTFESGDLIFCQIRRFPFATHALLATSESTVAHMLGEKLDGHGTLFESHIRHYRSNLTQQNCYKSSRATVVNAVERAQRDIFGYGIRHLYYHTVTCNCEHWVQNWSNGEAYSPQSFHHTDTKCQVGRSTYLDPKERVTVTLYQHSDSNIFGSGGRTVLTIIKEECFSWTKEAWWDNQASQVHVGDKCIRIWSGYNCKGYSSCYCESQGDLSARMMAYGKNWNKQISSMSHCDYKGEITTVVWLFEHTRFEGRRMKKLLQKSECVSFFFEDWWNDRVSSLRVTQGCVEYFVDINCWGESSQLSSESASVGKEFDDKISSIKPC